MNWDHLFPQTGCFQLVLIAQSKSNDEKAFKTHTHPVVQEIHMAMKKGLATETFTTVSPTTATSMSNNRRFLE